MTSIGRHITAYVFRQLLVDQGVEFEFVVDTSSTTYNYARLEELLNEYSLIAVLYYGCLESEFVVTFDSQRSVKK